MTGSEPNVPPAPDLVWSPPVARPRRPMWRPLSGLLCFAAAILTLLGSFLDLLTTDLQSPGERFSLTVSAWGARAFTNGAPDSSLPGWLIAKNGPPLIFAAFLLLVAAVLALLAAAAPANVPIVRASSLVAVAGLAFLAGTAWSILMQLLSWLDRFGPQPSEPEFSVRYDINTAVELGCWLLAAALAAAIAGVLFAFLPIRRRRPERTEPDTPPLGVPIGAAIVHRLPDAPPEDPE